MAIQIAPAAAQKRLLQALEWAFDPDREVPNHWIGVTERIGDSPSQTLVAGLGAALLARATRDDVDPLSIKAGYSERSFSLRTLCHGVLVPASKDPVRPFHLGARGREPLNNQPYFRYDHLDEVDRIHASARPYFEDLKTALRQLDALPIDEALAALAAFLRVRNRVQQAFDYERRAALPDSKTAETVLAAIVGLIGDDTADRPLRLQAIVGGLVSCLTDEVSTGAINDPSRHAPGDVHVPNQRSAWWAAEVRGKPVAQHEAIEFVRECSHAGIGSAWIVVISEGHQPLNRTAISAVARQLQVFVAVIESLEELLASCLGDPSGPASEQLQAIPGAVRSHLEAAGARTETLLRWRALLTG